MLHVIKRSIELFLIAVILASSIAGLQLFVDDSPVISVGDTFHTSLGFSEQDILPDHVSNDHTCVFINGDICGCWNGAYGSVRFQWTEDCMRSRVEAMTRVQTYYASLLLAPPTTADRELAPGVKRLLASTPVYMPSGARSDGLTLVLPLTIDDLSRSLVLLRTLQKMHTDVVAEMLVFVPDDQLIVIRGAMLGAAVELALTFTIRVQTEQTLFHIPQEELKRMYPYAIQMAIKLLAAEHVSTAFYLTLDADILQLREFDMKSLVRRGEAPVRRQGPPGRAVYHWEERAVHEAWWRGSERVLNVSLATSYAYQRWRHQDDKDMKDHQRRDLSETQRRLQGFGVTPALLSTYGSQLTLFHLCRTLTRNWDYQTPIDKADCQRIWLGNFGRRIPSDGAIANVDAQQQQASADPAGEVWLWSEYTLYRIALDHYEVAAVMPLLSHAGAAENQLF